MRVLVIILLFTLMGCVDPKSPANAKVVDETTSLVTFLDTIWMTEQTPIRLRDSLMKVHGVDSPEVLEQQKIYEENHAINERKIIDLLDQDGWPDEKDIGEQGAITICNVIQHSSVEVRRAYLPMMKAAVDDKKLAPWLLARAEDRLATDRGELQVYGSQVKFYSDTKTFDVWPIIDPENVDKRRAAIGLVPMADFLSQKRFQLNWDVQQQIERTLAFEQDKLLEE